MTQSPKIHKKISRKKIESETLRVQLGISTTKSEKFIDEMEKLCEKYCIEGDYFFTFE